MRCPICNKEVNETSIFCSNCGTRLIKKAETSENIQQATTDTVNPIFSPSLEKDTTIEDNSQSGNISASSNSTVNQVPFSNNESVTNQQETYAANPKNNDFNYYVPPKKKRSLVKLILFPLSTFVLVGAIILGLFYTSIFAGPLTNISKASLKTFSSESFNFELDVNIEGQNINFDGTMIFEPENRKLELYMDGKVSLSYKIPQTSYSDFSNDYNPTSPNSLVVFLKNGIVVCDIDGHVERNDISEQIDLFFDEYENNKESKKLDESNWKELFEELQIDTENVDFELFGEAFNEFAKSLNDEDYINDNLGDYSEKSRNGKTIYSLDFKLKDVANELIEVFGDAFFPFDKDSYKIEEFMSNELLNSKFKLVFKTNSGYLTDFNLTSDTFTFELEISDIGDATIDQDLSKYESYFS